MREYRTLRMYSEQLKKYKRIYIYLPEGYDTSEEFYSVLYMHDGQNLFDDPTAYHKRSWRILEEIEQTTESILPLIIVGIESDNSRTNELIPFPFEFEYADGVVGGKADLYLDFITTTLKPYIDKRFRTFKSRNNTGIMGSSFGGVNSFYAALKYNHIFSRFGCVSNAFHYDFYPPLKEMLIDSTLSNVRKLYMDYGTKETDDKDENERYMATNNEVFELVQSKLDETRCTLQVIEGATHRERDWQKRFIKIIQYLFTD